MNQTEAGSPCSKQEKPDNPISRTVHSSFIEIDDSQGRHQAVTRSTFSDQATSRWWRSLNHDNSSSCDGE
jgi:hypothetical protein